MIEFIRCQCYNIIRYLQQIFHIYTAAICTPLNSYHNDLLWKKNMKKKSFMVKALKAKSNVNLSQFYMTFISKIDRYDGTHFDFVTCTGIFHCHFTNLTSLPNH